MNELLMFDSFINPNKRLFWVYILSSIFLAFSYFYFTKKSSKVILSSKLWLHPSAKLDYYYFVLSGLLNIFLLVPFIVSAKTIALGVSGFLRTHFEYFDNSYFSYEMIVFLYTFCLFVVSDFTRYWVHRFFHTIPILWEFHKVHHSAKVLTPITFYRVHPVENIIFGLRYSLSIGLVTGVFIYFFGAMIDIYTVLGTNIFLFVFALLGSNLRHSQVPFAYPKFLEKWFISPKQHQIHHSKKHFDKNYGGYLAVWDRFFGSLKLSSEVKVLKYGFRKNQMSDYLTLKALLFRPFINLLEKYRRRNAL